MGEIRRLPEEVASQVAAGEVVERPASVVKELVENSLDAGATQVDVEYRQGGVGYLAVADNGRGMDRDDATLCLERHATSKIRTGRDLETVATFGFRGEAVPSIASVSKFRLCTRPAGVDAGTEILVAGGRIEEIRDCGNAQGTRIEVRSLFFNLPARRKFLRGERTEAAHIEQQFQIAALANSKVRFSLHRDGKQVRLLAPNMALDARVRDLFGAEFLNGLFEFNCEQVSGMTIHGLIARPGYARGDRSHQYLFVNGRAVQSQALSAPLREAYGSALPRGMHPPAVLFVSMDPREVDCNVHPAKREVRFRDANGVRAAIHDSVRMALDRRRQQSVVSPARVLPEDPAPDSSAISVSSEPSLRQRERSPDEAVRPSPAPEPVASLAADPLEVPGTPARPFAAPRPSELPLRNSPDRFRFIGQMGGRYVIMEDDAGMVLLDFRAARERVLFERILRQIHDNASAVAQRLLIPAVVELQPRDYAWVRENASVLERAGLITEPFGGGAVKVDAVPSLLSEAAVPELLARLIDDGRRSGIVSSVGAAEEAVARSVARFAPDEPMPTDGASLRAILTELMSCDLPYTCPGGRPTLVHFAFSELERKFGRGR